MTLKLIEVTDPNDCDNVALFRPLQAGDIVVIQQRGVEGNFHYESEIVGSYTEEFLSS